MMQDISCTTWSILALRKHLQLNITFLWQIGYLPLFPRPSRVVFGGLMVHSLSRRWGRKILPRTTMANKLIDHVKHWSRFAELQIWNKQLVKFWVNTRHIVFIYREIYGEWNCTSGWCGHPKSRCTTRILSRSGSRSRSDLVISGWSPSTNIATSEPQGSSLVMYSTFSGGTTGEVLGESVGAFCSFANGIFSVSIRSFAWSGSRSIVSVATSDMWISPSSWNCTISLINSSFDSLVLWACDNNKLSDSLIPKDN